jgi:hypothetical protein
MIKEHIKDFIHHAIKITTIFFNDCNNTTHLSYFIAVKPSQKKKKHQCFSFKTNYNRTLGKPSQNHGPHYKREDEKAWVE